MMTLFFLLFDHFLSFPPPVKARRCRCNSIRIEIEFLSALLFKVHAFDNYKMDVWLLLAQKGR
jgi:hypothetical protein